MAFKPNRSPRRPCRCGGANPNCVECEGRGFIERPGYRSVMTSPAGARRRSYVPRESMGTIPTIPEPVRCPHCGLDVLNLAVHMMEAHPEQPPPEAAAEREAREREEARQAAVAAELARREAEAAQRKAEARARRQAVEGLQSDVAWHERARGILPENPPRSTDMLLDTSAGIHPSLPAEAPNAGSADGARRHGTGSEAGRGAQTESRRPGPEDETWGA